MKTNSVIYFFTLIAGFLVLAIGDTFIQKEIAWSIGFVLMMFSIFKISRSWSSSRKEEENS